MQGILFAKPEAVKTVSDLIRLYLHESERVYCDKLVDKEDSDLFYKIQRDVIKKSLEVRTHSYMKILTIFLFSLLKNRKMARSHNKGAQKTLLTSL